MKTLGGAVYAGTASSLHARVTAANTGTQATSPLRVAVLDEASFPAIDGIAALPWREALKPFDVVFLSVADLSKRLSRERLDLLHQSLWVGFPTNSVARAP